MAFWEGSQMTRRSVTFKMKPEPFIWIVRLKRRGRTTVHGPYPRRQLLQPVQGRETDGGRGRGRAELQGWWWMRGSISNDGVSEAFTQEEEDRPQAGLCTTGSRGGVWLEHWCLLHLKSFRNISRSKKKWVQTGADWGYQTVERHRLMKGKRQEKRNRSWAENRLWRADLVLRIGRERGSRCLHGCAAASLVTCDLRPRST